MTTGRESEEQPKKRLRPKYLVSKIISAEGEDIKTELPMSSTNPEDVNSPFVLLPRKDPAAFVAMVTYAQYCEGKLAAEITEWLNKIIQAEPLFGSQGARNWTAGRARLLNEI